VCRRQPRRALEAVPPPLLVDSCYGIFSVASSSMTDHSNVSFIYDTDAFVGSDIVQPGGQTKTGLFGRHVANREFLDAWLRHGTWRSMIGVVTNQHSGNSLAAQFNEYARLKTAPRELEIMPLPHFSQRFFPDAPARLLHLPQPIEAEFGWLRQHKAAHSFALSGVTHTISLKGVMDRFRELVSGPFEPYDTLFCISKAAVAVVRAATDNYATYLRERHGGAPAARIRLAHVPFGIDTEKFRPATEEERLTSRRELGIAADELCVLFVGRLSYYSKVHPFPMYRAAAAAARRHGCKLHLVLAGWADSPSILDKFRHGAEAIAPGIKTSFVDATAPEARFRIWQAADVFTSMSDNIQETLGLTILEAQACGLPVLATDWDGCRESVLPGETGFLAKTRIVTGATADATSRHLMSETNYGEFLGEVNQAVAVDSLDASNAFERLFSDAALRKRMGAAGRNHILANYSWPGIIRQYESVWAEQELVRQEYAASFQSSSARTPVPFPDVEYLFSSYPSEWLSMETKVAAVDDASTQLPMLLRLPLSNYVPQFRVVAEQPLLALLLQAQKPCSLGDLDVSLAKHSGSIQERRRTLAWLLKYDLLRVISTS
jgi:glycosyltransferase involved in cell wall biosynthesis